MKIQKYKMERIAAALNAEKANLAKRLKSEAEAVATEFIKAQIPQEVNEFFEKYPQTAAITNFYVNVQDEKGSAIWTRNVRGHGAAKPKVFLTIPATDKRAKILLDYRDAADIEQKTYNRIFCALEKIGTYAKLKNEWPEAYAILLEIDGKAAEEKDKVCTCDDVEKLRAELKTKK